jgi:hypothetical protein
MTSAQITRINANPRLRWSEGLAVEIKAFTFEQFFRGFFLEEF